MPNITTSGYIIAHMTMMTSPINQSIGVTHLSEITNKTNNAHK